MCCSVLQCVVVCCSLLQGVAVCGSVMRCIAVCCSVLQCVAVCCSVLQCAAVCCNILQCVTECCSELLRVAVCCSVLQCVEIVPGRPSSGTTVLPILFLVKPLHCICSNTLSPVHGHDSFICVRRYTYRLIHTYDMTLCVCPILFFCEALVLYMQQHLVARIWT